MAKQVAVNVFFTVWEGLAAYQVSVICNALLPVFSMLYAPYL